MWWIFIVRKQIINVFLSLTALSQNGYQPEIHVQEHSFPLYFSAPTYYAIVAEYESSINFTSLKNNYQSKIEYQILFEYNIFLY